MPKRNLIGKKYRLKRAMLGNQVGAIGYAFNQYQDYDHKDEQGVQVIFPNGEYDGFSAEEQMLYLEEVEAKPKYNQYVFKNVMQVTSDFRDGYWNFKEQE